MKIRTLFNVFVSCWKWLLQFRNHSKTIQRVASSVFLTFYDKIRIFEIYKVRTVHKNDFGNYTFNFSELSFVDVFMLQIFLYLFSQVYFSYVSYLFLFLMNTLRYCVLVREIGGLVRRRRTTDDDDGRTRTTTTATDHGRRRRTDHGRRRRRRRGGRGDYGIAGVGDLCIFLSTKSINH